MKITVVVRTHKTDLTFKEARLEIDNSLTVINRTGQYLADRAICDYIELLGPNNSILGIYLPQ